MVTVQATVGDSNYRTVIYKYKVDSTEKIMLINYKYKIAIAVLFSTLHRSSQGFTSH